MIFIAKFSHLIILNFFQVKGESGCVDEDETIEEELENGMYLNKFHGLIYTSRRSTFVYFFLWNSIYVGLFMFIQFY